MTSPGRFAIYFVPAAGTRLAEIGSRWLGYDVETGATLGVPAVDGLSELAWTALTRAPRQYGFHATLKPPFELAPGCTAKGLADMTSVLADGLKRTSIPRLVICPLGNFLALRPDRPSNELGRIAAACVRALDGFRAPPDAADTARRRAAELTPRQDRLLQDWGYPYVLDEFRFHMTLTGPLGESERETVMPLLRDWFRPVLDEPVPFDALAMLHQPGNGAPFRVVDRFPLAA